MAAPVIQFKRGVLADLPGLRAGEPGFTTDAYDLYVGIDSTSTNNQFVGSGRYWSVNSTSKGSGVNLVEGTTNGTSFITLKSPDSLSGITTFVMPASGSADQFLKITSVSGNVHTLGYAAIPSGSFTLAADSGANDTFTTGNTLTFTGGEGIDTTVSDDTITIAAEDATETNKGVATFDGTDFTVTSGDVTLKAERIQDIAGAMFSSNTETGITATYQDGDGTIDLAVSISASEVAAGTLVTESEGIGSNDNDTTIPTSAAVKDYVDTNITAQDLDVAGDSGTAAVDLDSQSLTVAGTTNEIETSASGQTVTIGLPNNVTVSNNLTVSGNLYVNGSTTQVNTATTTIEDQLLDLGMVDGSVPGSDLNKDIGVLFNYYVTDTAYKAAVYWDDSTSRIVVSQSVSESSGVLTNNTGGALEVASLYVSGCGGTNEIIGCSGGEVVITNATIDGGSF